MSEQQLLQAIAVTAEMTGTTLSPGAAKAMFDDLRQYPEHQVLASLVRCRRQLKGRLSLADIIERLDDGRPGPEEAWAIVAQTRSEYATVVWTEEMRIAAGTAWPLIATQEMIPARMAFIEAYRKLVQEARDHGTPVCWTISLGHDPSGREGPIRTAVEKGLIPLEVAQGYLPLDVQLPHALLPELKKTIKQFPPL